MNNNQSPTLRKQLQPNIQQPNKTTHQKKTQTTKNQEQQQNYNT